jgi:anti-sigma factor RsiW
VTCREVSEFIADYLSGDIPDDVRVRFERHLTRCRNCQTYLASYKAAIDLGRRAFDCEDGEIGAYVPEELIQAIMAARGQRTNGMENG